MFRKITQSIQNAEKKKVLAIISANSVVSAWNQPIERTIRQYWGNWKYCCSFEYDEKNYPAFLLNGNYIKHVWPKRFAAAALYKIPFFSTGEIIVAG